MQLGGGPAPRPGAVDTSFVGRVFGGRLRSRLECACGRCSDTYDPFLDLSLEITKSASVEGALRRFCAPEVLEGANQYRCEHTAARAKVRATKALSIDVAPLVLQLQLKRFQYGAFGAKITKNVSFPAVLELAPFMSPQAPHGGATRYALYAVLVHSGRSTHSGHYYSFVKSPAGAWFCADDSRVHPVGEAAVMGQNAYMLFYIQQPEGGGQQEEAGGEAARGTQTHAAAAAEKAAAAAKGAAAAAAAAGVDAGMHRQAPAAAPKGVRLRPPVPKTAPPAPPPRPRPPLRTAPTRPPLHPLARLASEARRCARQLRMRMVRRSMIAAAGAGGRAEAAPPGGMRHRLRSAAAHAVASPAEAAAAEPRAPPQPTQPQPPQLPQPPQPQPQEPPRAAQQAPPPAPSAPHAAAPRAAGDAPRSDDSAASDAALLAAQLSHPPSWSQYGRAGVARWDALAPGEAAAADAAARSARPAFAPKRAGVKRARDDEYDAGRVKKVKPGWGRGGEGEEEGEGAAAASRNPFETTRPPRGRALRGPPKRGAGKERRATKKAAATDAKKATPLVRKN